MCSCFPLPLLGRPPDWYKSRSYRARSVREPRKVLAECGLARGEQTEVRVHDSTADCRYMVLPLRPEGTEGWDEEAGRYAVRLEQERRPKRLRPENCRADVLEL